MADDALNEIFVRPPDGRFQVLAGNGTGGDSGDGGPAVRAELDRPEGMAVSADGTVYFADAGNGRVRAVLPTGVIVTVAGNGQAPVWPASPVSGVSATSSAIGTTEAVTIGPEGTLYIAASDAVMALDSHDTLSTVVSEQSTVGVDQRFPGADCGPDGLAFDGSGDLFMTCQNTNDLLEKTAAGSVIYRGILRPHDASAALTASPDGSVIGLWQSEVYRFTATQQQAVRDFDRVPGIGDFWPQGVAVAADGTMYMDQDGISGIGPRAIVEVSPAGDVTAVWPRSGTGTRPGTTTQKR